MILAFCRISPSFCVGSSSEIEMEYSTFYNVNQTSYDMNYTFDDWSFFFNDTDYTSELDFGFVTPELTPAPRSLHPLEQASQIIFTCGIATNGIFTFILIGILAMSRERRVLSRMWLLLGIITANLLYSIVNRFLEAISEWPPVTSNVVVCSIVIHLHLCLELVSILSSVLLAYNIFLRVYAPTTGGGPRQLAFWISAEIVCWVLGFSAALGIRSPYAEIVEIHGRSPLCMYRHMPYLNLLYSCLTFLLPYAIVLPVTCCSLPGVIRPTSGNPRQEAIELAPKTGGCQFNPEYFAVADANPKESDSFAENARKPATQNKKSSRTWVIFNFLNIFLGFACRLLYNLAAQEFVVQSVFRRIDSVYGQLIMWRVLVLVDSIYVSFMPLLCLMVAEVGCGIKDKCTLGRN